MPPSFTSPASTSPTLGVRPAVHLHLGGAPSTEPPAPGSQPHAVCVTATVSAPLVPLSLRRRLPGLEVAGSPHVFLRAVHTWQVCDTVTCDTVHMLRKMNVSRAASGANG